MMFSVLFFFSRVSTALVKYLGVVHPSDVVRTGRGYEVEEIITEGIQGEKSQRNKKIEGGQIHEKGGGRREEEDI